MIGPSQKLGDNGRAYEQKKKQTIPLKNTRCQLHARDDVCFLYKAVSLPI
jgi:hypothetical protein